MPMPDPDRHLPDPGDDPAEECPIHRCELDRYGCPQCERDDEEAHREEQDAWEMGLPE